MLRGGVGAACWDLQAAREMRGSFPTTAPRFYLKESINEPVFRFWKMSIAVTLDKLTRTVVFGATSRVWAWMQVLGPFPADL